MDSRLDVLIPLSKKGKHAGKYTAIVSSEDANLAELNWRVKIDTSTLRYAHRGHRDSTGKIIEISLHRAVMERMLNRPLERRELVDHKDGNGLNCARGNLRMATTSQNTMNSRMPITNTSGYKGVTWHKGEKKWVAQIKINGKLIQMGYFNTPELAHEAYCRKADELFGEFANYGTRLNTAAAQADGESEGGEG